MCMLSACIVADNGCRMETLTNNVLAIDLHRHRSLLYVCWDFICYTVCCFYLVQYVCFDVDTFAISSVFICVFMHVISVQQFRHFLRFRNSSYQVTPSVTLQ